MAWSKLELFQLLLIPQLTFWKLGGHKNRTFLRTFNQFCVGIWDTFKAVWPSGLCSWNLPYWIWSLCTINCDFLWGWGWVSPRITWCSFLTFSCFYRLQLYHPTLTQVLFFCFRKGRWTEKVSFERRESLLLLKVGTVDEVLPDKILLDIWGSDGRWLHWAARPDRSYPLFFFKPGA